VGQGERSLLNRGNAIGKAELDVQVGLRCQVGGWGWSWEMWDKGATGNGCGPGGPVVGGGDGRLEAWSGNLVDCCPACGRFSSWLGGFLAAGGGCPGFLWWWAVIVWRGESERASVLSDA